MILADQSRRFSFRLVCSLFYLNSDVDTYVLTTNLVLLFDKKQDPQRHLAASLNNAR